MKKILISLLALILVFSTFPMCETLAEEYPQLNYYEMKDMQGIYDIADNTASIKHINLEPETEETFEDSYFKIIVENEGYLFLVQYDKYDNRFWGSNGIDDDRSLITSIYSGKSLTSSIPRTHLAVETNDKSKWQVVIYEAYYLPSGTYYIGACYHRPNGSGNNFYYNGQESMLYAGFLASSKVFSVKNISYNKGDSDTLQAVITFNYPSDNINIIEAAPGVSGRYSQEIAESINYSSKKVSTDNSSMTVTQNGEYTARYFPATANFLTYKIPFYIHFTVDIDNGKGKEKEKEKDTNTSEVKLNYDSKTIKVGENFKLKVTGAKEVSFKSSKKSVAKVSASGKVVGKKKGTATIKVTCDNGETYKCKVTVKK